MTLTDDTLVRELAERADRAIPAMALDPVGVLAAGRRHRRRQTAIRSVGGLALVAVAAVGVVQLGGSRSETPPATTTLGSLVIRVPSEVRVVDPPVVRLLETDSGSTDPRSAVDLGVPVTELDETPGAGPSTYALMIANLTVEGETGPALYIGSVRADGSFDPRAGGGLTGEVPESAANPRGFQFMSGDHHAATIGVLPPGFDGAVVELVVVGVAGEQVIDVPTFEVPGLDSEAYFVVAEDPELRTVRWPEMYVRMTAPDGSVSRWGLAGYEPPAVGGGAPVVTAAVDVTEVETDLGPAVDLAMTAISPLTADSPGEIVDLVLVPTLDAYAATVAPSGSDATYRAVQLRPRGASGIGDPILEFGWPQATDGHGLSDEDFDLAESLVHADGAAYVVGVLPSNATSAKMTVGAGDPVAVPTFTTPSLPGATLYVAVVQGVDLDADAIAMEFSDGSIVVGGWTSLP